MTRTKGNGNRVRAARRQTDVDLRERRDTLDGLVHQLTTSRRSLEQIRDYSLAQRDLALAYRQFSELYDFLPIGYLLLDARGLIRRVNDGASRLFGFRRAAVLGRPLVAFFDRQSTKTIVQALLGGSGAPTRDVNFEGRLATLASSARVRVVMRRVQVDEHEIEHHVAMVDLTEARELQEQTRRAERESERSREAERVAREASEAKDQFLATLSHELRTPLTPILSAVDSLKHLRVPGDLEGILAVIRRNVRAEARLIDDLLDVARITQKKLVLTRVPLDLHDVLGRVAEDWMPTLRSVGVELTLSLAAQRHHVAGDAMRLGQVCRNLLSNAVKFTDAGGRIRLTTRSQGGVVTVEVQDTGVGMPPEHALRVFEPFVQVSAESGRRGGLGLGLVICRGIVDAHDGRIYATSEGPGHGTTVTIELPVIPVPVDEVHEPARPAPAAGLPTGGDGAGRRRVLLLEDHRDSAQMLTLLLESEGYEVTVAGSKREGLAKVADCDLVVSDIGLPDGTGLEFMTEARARRPLPAIALSGFGSEQDVQRSLDAGFAEHLTKPVDFEQLLAALDRLSGTSAARPPGPLRFQPPCPP